MRDLAFDALVKEPDWSGRDEWYYSLLEDETLGDLRVGGASYTGLTTIIMYSPPEKYQDKMIELVKSTNLTVRNAAPRNFSDIADREHPDAVRALLPCFEDPKWARDTGGERQRLVSILQSLKMPECVPGLIAMLDEKEMQEFPVREVPSAAYSSDRVANAMNTAVAPMRSTSNANSSYSVRTIAIARHPYRDQAIRAWRASRPAGGAGTQASALWSGGGIRAWSISDIASDVQGLHRYGAGRRTGGIGQNIAAGHYGCSLHDVEHDEQRIHDAGQRVFGSLGRPRWATRRQADG